MTCAISRSSPSSSKRFLTFLPVDHMRAAEKNRTDEHGVQLMTIHRSKGLEFKAVYVLGTVDGSIPHDFSLETARKGDEAALEEERRLLYVAMTRAKTAFIFVLPANRRGKTANRSRFCIPFYKKQDSPYIINSPADYCRVFL